MAQLITALEIITTCFTNKSTDTALLKTQLIEIAQEEHIRPILGQDLYDLIVAENETQVYTGLNATLHTTYIKPCLAFYVKFEALPDMNMNTTSKGIISNNSEFGSQVSSAQRAELSIKVRSHADTLRDKMIRYIEDNPTSFTLYSTVENITTNNKFLGGIVL
jgi:hypothetical protein